MWILIDIYIFFVYFICKTIYQIPVLCVLNTDENSSIPLGGSIILIIIKSKEVIMCEDAVHAV